MILFTAGASSSSTKPALRGGSHSLSRLPQDELLSSPRSTSVSDQDEDPPLFSEDDGNDDYEQENNAGVNVRSAMHACMPGYMSCSSIYSLFYNKTSNTM